MLINNCRIVHKSETEWLDREIKKWNQERNTQQNISNNLKHIRNQNMNNNSTTIASYSSSNSLPNLSLFILNILSDLSLFLSNILSNLIRFGSGTVQHNAERVARVRDIRRPHTRKYGFYIYFKIQHPRNCIFWACVYFCDFHSSFYIFFWSFWYCFEGLRI